MTIKLKDVLLGEAAQTGRDRGNPLGGKSKTNAKNWILGKISRHTRGFYSDAYWLPIQSIWKDFDALRLNWTMMGAKYEEEMTTFPDGGRFSVPVRKIWTFEVKYVNNRDKDDVLYGRVVAAGAGSVEDPLDRYDVTVTLG